MMRPLLLLLALALAACGPLVQIGAGRPIADSLLVIESTAKPQPSPNTLGMTLTVELPQLPATLQTLRLPVRTSDSEIKYLSGASWAESPNRQFQRLLSDTLASRGMAILDRSQAATRPSASLSGTLRDFTLDVRTRPMVVVRYDAQLSRPGQPTPIALRRFEVTEPVADQSPAEVAAALARAANRLATELADWTGASLS
jgi:cholesterol transport system auxiliary component